MTSHKRPLKITVVGDAMVGKTSLLITYTTNQFPDVKFLPNVYDSQACNISVDGKDYSTTLWDTLGQEGFERLRPLSYQNTACFLLCYSCSNRTSFDNVKSKWFPEIRHFTSHTPVVLVGTKLDKRAIGSEKFVTTSEGKKLKKEIRAHSLVECSAKNNNNLHKVFEEAIRAIERKPQPCVLL